MKKNLLILSLLLPLSMISIILSLPVKAESAYAPHPSNTANILGTGVQIEDTVNDYNVSIPYEYKSVADGNLDYRGTATAAQMYTTIGSNGFAPLGLVTNADPFAPKGISKPIILPVPPKTFDFLGETKYFHYYVVQVVNSLYPNKGNNYAFEAGDTLPTNALFAWAYYSDSPGITINYKTTDGNSLGQSITYFGELGDTANTTEKQFNGYTLLQIPQVGAFTKQEQSYDYIYTKQNDLGAIVTVRYVDTQGKSIAENRVLTGNVGEFYQADQLPIDGYSFKASSGNTNGKFTEQEQTVTYIYDINKTKAGNVTVNYVDTEGHSITDNKVLSGYIGDPYQTEQLSIEGYTFKASTGNTSGKFTEQTQSVSYVYVKNSTNFVMPTASDKNPDTSPKQVIEAAQKQLPETGEKQNTTLLYLIVGLFCLTVGISITVLQNKKG